MLILDIVITLKLPNNYIKCTLFETNLTYFKTILLTTTFFITFVSSYADKCYEIQLTDGSEDLVDFGLDTTFNWWAVTQTFSNRQKMYINDYTSDNFVGLSKPVFSPDGEKWAFFAQGFSGWDIVYGDSLIELNADRPGDILFSSNSENILYSYYRSDLLTVVSIDDTVNVRYKEGSLYINNTGDKFAYIESRGGIKTVYNDGKVSEGFQDIRPIGYWHNDDFAFAAFDGANWKIYIGEEERSDMYSNIFEYKINLTGDYLAFLGTLNFGGSEAVLIDDNMSAPMTGKNYPQVMGLAIHPHQAMFAYRAFTQLNTEIVVFNSVEYTGGRENSNPYFSYDGSEMYFIACTIDCNLIVNGQQITAPNGIFIDGEYAKKPNSNTLGYASSTSLIVRDLDENELYAGMMMEYTEFVRYNWRLGEYESLGVINNRLYLQACEF